MILNHNFQVQIHQDASYLHVEPTKLAGVWIALEGINFPLFHSYFD
jgi:hypothetical protein